MASTNSNNSGNPEPASGDTNGTPQGNGDVEHLEQMEQVEQPPPEILDPRRGGTGEPQQMTAKDIRLMERAVKQGWDIPDAAFKVVPAEVIKIAIGVDVHGQRLIDTRGHAMSYRTQLAAARTLAMMHAANVAQNPPEQEVVHTLEISDDERTRRIAGILNAARARRTGSAASSNGSGNGKH